MRQILLLILPILIILAVGFAVLGVAQVRFEEEKLLEDLQHKARSVTQSVELSVKRVLLEHDIDSAEYIVTKIGTSRRFQGGVIYDRDGRVIAVSGRFRGWEEQSETYVRQALTDKKPRSHIRDYKEYTVYSYVLPVVSDDAEVLGLVEVMYDATYVLNRISEIWKRLSITLLALVVLIVTTSLLIHRQVFIMPVKRLTEWFEHFQKGETNAGPPVRGQQELVKLAIEIEQVALSLRVQRKTITEEARQRIEKEELWTEAKLRDLVVVKLGDNALCVVSNREPYMHMLNEQNDKARCVRPASGVVTAIDPILRACGGTWVAHGSGNADRKFVNSKDKLGVPPDDNRYILKRVWLTKEEEEGYYFGFANEGLWPLCHITHTRPLFREADWQAYKSVNAKFAEAVLEEIPRPNPFVFIQDYHFTLVPALIKQRRPDAVVALFWHIPWPTPETFSICPYQREILEGMLGCDLIGFQVQYHCNNFLDTANRLLESRVDTEKFSVIRRSKETYVRSFPISVDSCGAVACKDQDGVEVEQIRRELELKDKIVAVGVDRIDYTKGLAERMLAIDRFLEKYPQYRKKFVFIQLAAPSRTHIRRYHALIGEIDELVERINWKYYEGNWQPIIYLRRHFSIEEIRPYYQLADCCIVSSLDDGMNLVAKEFVVSKKNMNGVLVLSRFTGAARELTDAVLVNPYSTEEFAEGIRQAVEMPPEEKQRRMSSMRAIVSENNVYRWAGTIITELAALKKM